ncbi:universal stress protein [Novosphingobium cyanobacteriorum]|uniref:Universal stress protein n=1 Tax=Novosphingobium cyanobacteriorum TaxID=3024215 RepID=A0ABT6CDR9_9SPHN|nr:universal stress protein [Novosphingobium cyanobacteriorum]MDF8331951.1 universal stress protein [Novosphingobium cyanobacteriorum]
MRSILCPADSADSLNDRVETALALARATNGHVTFQIATPFAQMAMWEPFGGAALSAEAINQVRVADEKLAADLDARLARQDVAFDVEIVDEGRIEGIAAAARFVDVIVASLDDPGLEEVGLGVRCPVLAVPRGAPLLAFDAPVMVAWDGGHESAAALRASLPLLRMASAVHLVTVREKSSDFPASDAACYLSRHDIHAECHEVERNHSIAFTLEDMARKLDAGLIVMGLYGKSRLRELLLGGVSRDLLDRSTVPLLLAH